MSTWDLPQYLDLAILPLDDWDGETRPYAQAQRSKFSATASATFGLLRTELDALDATDRVLYVPVSAHDFRRDGRPKVGAKLTGSALVLQFEASGRHEYVADRFLSWQENLRAIALTLESLRAVARYGLTGDRQQYAGFLALEAPAPMGFGSRKEASDWLVAFVGEEGLTLGELLRRARRKAHPDMGGNADDFQRITEAEEMIR